MQEKNNFKNFIWNAIGLTANCFVSLLLLVSVNIINGIDKAGIFTYSYSLCILFYYISIYYNRPFQIAKTNTNDDFNLLFSTRILTSVISLILILIFSLISKFSIYKLSIIMLLMFFKTCDSISDVFHGNIQKNDKLYLVGISYFLKSLLGIIVFIIVDLITHNLCLSILFLIVTNIIIIIFYDYNNFKIDYKSKICFKIDDTFQLLKLSFPIFAFQFISIYLSNCEKYVITYFSSNDLQTVFGILIMPATLLGLVGNYLIIPFINKLNKLNSENDFVNFKRIGNKILLFLFGFGIFTIAVSFFIGIPILNFVYQINLNEYKLELIIIVLASIFNSAGMICSGMLTILGKNKIQVYVYGITAILTTVICYFSINNNIIFGASITYLISCIILFISFIYIYFKELKSRR